MGDAVDRMYEVALWGYAFGRHVYPFFRAGAASWLLMTLMAVAFVWRLQAALLNDEEPALMAFAKWAIGSAVVLAMLYNPVYFPLSERSHMRLGDATLKKNLYGTDEGAMPWISYQIDKFMDGWIEFGSMIAKRENRFLYPGARLTSIEDFSKADAISDPQTRSIISQWQEVIVPALLQNPSLAEKMKAEGLTGFLMYPVTSSADINDPDGVTQKSRRVVELLRNEPGLDLVSSVRSLSGFLNSPEKRLSGKAMTVDASETAVAAELLSAYTTKAPRAPITPPSDYSSKAVNAYTAGLRVLSSLADDPNRQPPPTFANYAELYKYIGFAVDIALARQKMQTPEGVTNFGISCLNSSDANCKQAVTVANTNMKPTEQSLDWGNRTLRAGMAIVGLGSAWEQGAMEFNKVELPMYIGIAKGLVTAMGFFFLILMLWPGRFVQGLSFLVGGYVLVGLWMFFYIIWTYLVSDFLFGDNGLTQMGVMTGISTSAAAYSPMVKTLVAGYGALGAVSWMIVMGGLDKAHRGFGGQATATQRVGSGAKTVLKVAGTLKKFS